MLRLNYITKSQNFYRSYSTNQQQHSKAQKSLQKYLSPWPREVKQQKKDEKATTKPPVFILGKAGQIAMKIWRQVVSTEGSEGLDRVQREFFVFLHFTKESQKWSNLVHTPDAFLPIEEKIKSMTSILNGLGCSDTFISLMIPLLKDGSISKLEQVTTDFNEINRAHRREVDVTLVTGKKLDETSLDFYKSSIALDFFGS